MGLPLAGPPLVAPAPVELAVELAVVGLAVELAVVGLAVGLAVVELPVGELLDGELAVDGALEVEPAACGVR